MGLSEFITRHQDEILAECEAFAETMLPAAAKMDREALRDHARQVLQAIALGMTQPQTRRQQHDKSQGNGPKLDDENPTAAEIHGALRATDGFDVNQTTAEYRSLRASVIRLWFESGPQLGRAEVFELVRFNEAMDQALAESILQFAAEAAQARNVFLGVLSHELRTPLATITTSAHSLLRADPSDEPVPGAAARVQRAGRRIESLLDDLLDYVRSGLGEGMRVTPVSVDLGEVCERIVGELQAVHPDSTIVVERHGDLSCVCDEQRIAQALSNLVGNAIKYGSADTPVRVTLRSDDDGLTVAVANAGSEVSKETLDTLFEPLVRGTGADRSGVSLGLGLYIVREIALAHGGTVGVACSPESGTVFEIRLPRQAQIGVTAAFPGMRIN